MSGSILHFYGNCPSLPSTGNKEYKSLLDIEMYLTIDMAYIHRRTLANFRCSNHNLSIETGRHNKIERYLDIVNIV